MFETHSKGDEIIVRLDKVCLQLLFRDLAIPKIAQYKWKDVIVPVQVYVAKRVNEREVAGNLTEFRPAYVSISIVIVMFEHLNNSICQIGLLQLPPPQP